MSWRKGNRLHLVNESEASAPVREVFDEVKTAVGISYVPLAFRAFAAYPDFLQLQWQTVRPLLGTREFFELAARLQAEAYTYVHNYFKVPVVGDGLAISQALPVSDVLSYSESAMLLLLSVQLQAFEGAVGNNVSPHAADRVVYSAKPEFITPESSPSALKRSLEDLRHFLELPYSGDETRALAQWPELFFAYWRAFKPAVQTVLHERAIFQMRESAWNCAQEIPVQVDMEYSRLVETGLDAEEVATVTRMTELLVRGTAVGLLNITFAKIGLEGGNRGEAEASAPDTEKVA